MINHAKHPMFPITFLLLIGSIVFLILSTRKFYDPSNKPLTDDYKREMTNFRMVSIVLGILAIVAVNLVGKN